jgi:hypothetical protein
MMAPHWGDAVGALAVGGRCRALRDQPLPARRAGRGRAWGARPQRPRRRSAFGQAPSERARSWSSASPVDPSSYTRLLSRKAAIAGVESPRPWGAINCLSGGGCTVGAWATARAGLPQAWRISSSWLRPCRRRAWATWPPPETSEGRPCVASDQVGALVGKTFTTAKPGRSPPAVDRGGGLAQAAPSAYLPARARAS